jgi:co-chaperonin GroES (HSP10)
MSDDYGYIPPLGERKVYLGGARPPAEDYRGEIAAHLEGVTFRPTGCKVLIELDEADAFYEGTTILMPQSYRDVSEHGTVVGVGGGVYVGGNENGTGARHYPLTLKVGDRVRLRRWNMTELMLNGKLHVVMPESDILWTEGDET